MGERFQVGKRLLFFVTVILLIGAPGLATAKRLAVPFGDDKASPVPADRHGCAGEDDAEQPYEPDPDGEDDDWDEPAPWPEPPEAEPELPEPDGLEGAALWTHLADPYGGALQSASS